MRILVCGAAGMLGHAVTRAAEARGHEVAAFGHAELDVTNGAAVDAALAGFGAGAVVNCAAWTDVDGAEAQPEEAMRVNATGAQLVARAAATAGARAVHVSTDYVFDGAKDAPYVESDPPGPVSAYGRSKLAGEQAVAESPRHLIARSSWLFGAHGRNFVDTILRAGRERGEVRVVDDQIGCPTYTGHLADALLELTESGVVGVRHVAGTGACSWHDLAVEAFRQAGIDCRVYACSTADMPRPAPRPRSSVLASEYADTPRLPPWQEGLERYLTERKVAAR